jgi:hypothetical protein
MPNNQVALPSVSDMGSIILRSTVSFAKNHKVISSSYVFGILFLLLIGSGTKLTLDQRQQYNSIMNTIDLNAEYEASNQFAMANQAYRATKGWFSCDSLCQRNKRRMEHTQRILDDIRTEGYARMSDAKGVAGLFSEIGVEEVKDSFWHYFHSGKQFAKRQSMWDAMFMGIRSMSRDETMINYLLRVFLQVLVNFSMGLIAALGIFIFGLWSIIKSYQPNPLTALIFFVGCSCAAFAFVSTYLLAIYGAAAGSLYGVAKVAENQARLQNGGQNGYDGRRNVQYHAHTH